VKRSIGNAITIRFRDGTSTERIAVEYPIGHRRRRKEGIPLLLSKFDINVRGRLSSHNADAVVSLCNDAPRLQATPVQEFMHLFVA
jgi:2-methylcitrate dehydratase